MNERRSIAWHRRMLAQLVAAISCLSGSVAFAQPAQESSLRLLTLPCEKWRVSESAGHLLTRKPIGKPTASLCREVAGNWLERYVAWVQEKGEAPGQRALTGICRDVAERLAGRAVEVAWCSTWDFRRDTQPPDDVWAALDVSPLALDVSPLAGFPPKNSTRDRLLSDVLEKRLVKSWDQGQIETHLLSIGFSCRPVSTVLPGVGPIRNSICTAGPYELVAAPSRALRLGLHIRVVIKFASSGQPPGWQKIELRTVEMRLDENR